MSTRPVAPWMGGLHESRVAYNNLEKQSNANLVMDLGEDAEPLDETFALAMQLVGIDVEGRENEWRVTCMYDGSGANLYFPKR